MDRAKFYDSVRGDVLMGTGRQILEGSTVKATGKIAQIPVLFGHCDSNRTEPNRTYVR